jgi:hypothetical protein
VKVEIERHPYVDELYGPQRAPRDPRRLRDVEAALLALEPVVTPLAVEVELGRRDADGLLEPSGRVVVLAERELPRGLELRPTVATEPETIRVPRLSPAALAGQLAREVGQEWVRISALLVAARVDAPSIELPAIRDARLEPRDGHRAAVGPYPTEGLAFSPPIGLRFLDDYGNSRLELTRHWSPWTTPGTPERQRFDDALAGLAKVGWGTQGPA